ncbi:unnamed protein product [Lactuca virosa]|uniref:Uncharacterized protein n=1 Tax=Lactuca virosa TaxID=75947 RepID=A0AAU9PPL1_9ASTR|nr:unnamed protein product [Lactuca virosa]
MPTSMRSHRTIEFKTNFMNPRSQTPNFTVPDSRRRTQIRKKNDRKTEAVAVAEQPSKNLVMGQVTILKRGEVLNNSSRILKDMNSREDFTGVASIAGGKNLIADQEDSKVVTSGRRKQKNSRIAPSMGHDLQNVSMQMKKMSECFAGCIFSDSPPPSSVPLPGFLKRSLLNP